MNSGVSRVEKRAQIDAELAIADYVAGRLEGAELDALESRLERDTEMAQLVQEERELSAAIGAAYEQASPHARAFEKLRPRLARSRPSVSSRWGFLAAAASTVAAVMLISVMQVKDPEFVTLSTERAAPIDESNRIRIVFADHVRAAERDAAALAYGFRIVSGPGAGGGFLAETDTRIDRAELLRWREDTRIDLAEPVNYESDP